MRTLSATLLASLIMLGASAARADELTKLLQKGPMARVEFDAKGKFTAVLSVTDVDAAPDDLWRALTEFESYRYFMPRVASVKVRPGPQDTQYVDWNIDTPLVATKYTNQVTIDQATMLLKANTVSGDMAGSRYDWRVVTLPNGKCRMLHGAWPRNYAAIVATLDDDQQTLTIGVAVGSVLATTRAIKARAEALARERQSRATVEEPATSTR